METGTGRSRCGTRWQLTGLERIEIAIVAAIVARYAIPWSLAVRDETRRAERWSRVQLVCRALRDFHEIDRHLLADSADRSARLLPPEVSRAERFAAPHSPRDRALHATGTTHATESPASAGQRSGNYFAVRPLAESGSLSTVASAGTGGAVVPLASGSDVPDTSATARQALDALAVDEHLGGAQFILVDGAVVNLCERISTVAFSSIVTIRGGEADANLPN